MKSWQWFVVALEACFVALLVAFGVYVHKAPVVPPAAPQVSVSTPVDNGRVFIGKFPEGAFK